MRFIGTWPRSIPEGNRPGQIDNASVPVRGEAPPVVFCHAHAVPLARQGYRWLRNRAIRNISKSLPSGENIFTYGKQKTPGP